MLTSPAPPFPPSCHCFVVYKVQTNCNTILNWNTAICRKLQPSIRITTYTQIRYIISQAGDLEGFNRNGRYGDVLCRWYLNSNCLFPLLSIARNSEASPLLLSFINAPLSQLSLCTTSLMPPACSPRYQKNAMGS
jgi:hypothetical protein